MSRLTSPPKSHLHLCYGPSRWPSTLLHSSSRLRGRSLLPEQLASYALGGLALLLTLVLAVNATEPTAAIVLLHLCFFFVAATVCHDKLASDRPDATRLAEFYLCVAIGGMLGGLFNTLIAPTTFNTIIEYPLVIVLACLIRST